MSDLNKPWGILDESTDLHRALAASDCLIGDASSITVLYNPTGKPVLLLDVELNDEMTEGERDEYLHSDIIGFMFGPEVKPEWGFSATCNALYKIDIQNASAEFVSSVPWEKNMSRAYYSSLKIKNKLLLLPVLGRSFAIYDIDSGEWTRVPVPTDAVPTKNTHPVFSGAVHCGDHLLILPGVNGVFAKYDFESGEFSFYSSWFNKFKHNIVDINRGLLDGSCIFDGKIYLTSPQCNVVTELNPNDMSFKLHRVGEKANKYCGITYTKDAFWLIKYLAAGQKDLCAELLEWHPDTGKCAEHTSLPVTRDESRTGRAFSAIISVDDDVYLFPWHSDNIIKFDTTTKKGEIYKPKPEFNYFESKGKYYTLLRGIAMPWVSQEASALYQRKKENFGNSVVYIPSPTDYSLIKLDLRTGEYTRKKWCVNGAEHLLAKIERPGSVPFTPHCDTELYGLDHFLNELVSGELPAVDIKKRDYFRSLHANADGSAGKKIYEYLKRLAL